MTALSAKRIGTTKQVYDNKGTTKSRSRSAKNEQKKHSVIDVNDYKMAIVNEIAQNNYIAPTGITFKSNQIVFLPKEIIKKYELKGSTGLNSALNNSEDVKIKIPLKEADEFADEFSKGALHLLQATYAQLLGYIFAVMKKFGLSEESCILEFSCDYDLKKKQFADSASVKVIVHRSAYYKSSLLHRHAFAKLSNLLLMQFSTKQVTPKVQLIQDNSGIYHFELKFDFSIFTFTKRKEMNILDAIHNETAYIDSYKQWIRCLDYKSNRENPRTETDFEVDEANERYLSEIVTLAQFHYERNLNLTDITQQVFESIKNSNNLTNID